MACWRDSTSPQAQDDLDGLLNLVLPLAEQTISKYGEMFPFGAAVTTEGQVVMLGADPGSGEHPASPDVLAARVHRPRASPRRRQKRMSTRGITIAMDISPWTWSGRTAVPTSLRR